MKVAEIMHKNPVCVTAHETLTNIAKQMKKGDFGVVIVKESDKTLGVITDRDIVIKGLASGSDIEHLTADKIMTTKIVSCNSEDTLEAAANKMKSAQVRRLPVMDKQHKLVGIVSLGDLALSEHGKEKGAIFEALESISKHH